MTINDIHTRIMKTNRFVLNIFYYPLNIYYLRALIETTI